MASVLVTGAAGPIAEAVVGALADDPAIGRVRVVAPRPVGLAPGPSLELRVADLVESDLDAAFDGVDTVVHLGAPGDEVDPTLLAPGRVADEARAVLAAAGKASVARLVALSSTVVYGAWPSNPVPLTEEAVLRPNADFALAVELGEVERLVSDWADGHPGAAVTVLRAAPTVADDQPDWLSRALRTALALPVADHDPATQFLHAADLASAVVLAARGDLTGVANVAPDGWVSGSTRRALDGRPRVRLPERFGAKVADLRWRIGRAPAPANLLPYVTHPWVVANDRLVAAGWQPRSTNEDAYVLGFRAGPWATLSPQRRQELALAGASAGLVGVAVGVASALARRRRG